jgi:hypothetical protein
MKVYDEIVFDFESLDVVSEKSHEYEGPVAECGGGGGGGKGGGHSQQYYIDQANAQAQARLAAEKAAQEAADEKARKAEEERKAELRRQMLGNRNVTGAEDDDEAAIQKNVLG